jgi:hypothetical protein
MLISDNTKKITRNPFSSQRRKRSEPTGGEYPYQTFSGAVNHFPMPPKQSQGNLITSKQSNTKQAKTNEALNLINPEKFIQQNNFIPVPSMMMTSSKSPGPIVNQYSYAQGNTLMGRNTGHGLGSLNWKNGMTPSSHAQPSMLMTSPHFSNFFESGENMTRERFAKSREQAKRNKSRT